MNTKFRMLSTVFDTTACSMCHFTSCFSHALERRLVRVGNKTNNGCVIIIYWFFTKGPFTFIDSDMVVQSATK